MRVQRTRKLLEQALLELTIEQGFVSITVRDIARRAMVNRSTFYRHYLDKYDLLNQYLDKLQETIAETASAAEAANLIAPERVPAGLLVFVKHIQMYADFYRVMLGKNGDQAFMRRFRQFSEQRYQLLFARAGTVTPQTRLVIEMKLHYISYAMTGTISWWLENHQPITAEQLAIWLGQMNMTSAGFPYLLNALPD